MGIPNSYNEEVPNEIEFAESRDAWRSSMSQDAELRKKAVDLLVEADKYNYGFQWEWAGVPIIRHPDDIVLQQEIVWKLKPARIVETGIARGGSLVLSSHLMSMSGLTPQVLGIDLTIFQHARDALETYLAKGWVEIFEGDSVGELARDAAAAFLGNVNEPCLLVLDSNHSHEHVKAELETYAPLLPIGSIIMVADTIVEEMPEGYYENRPWQVGSNPLTAAHQFIRENDNFEAATEWNRRSLLGECRDGIIRKVG